MEIGQQMMQIQLEHYTVYNVLHQLTSRLSDRFGELPPSKGEPSLGVSSFSVDVCTNEKIVLAPFSNFQ